jgi:hypothetical protein
MSEEDADEGGVMEEPATQNNSSAEPASQLKIDDLPF